MKRALPLLALLIAGCHPSEGGSAAASYPSGFPDALKNDAYAYYGLGGAKTQTFEVKDDAGMRGVGTRTVRLDKIADGKAIYILSQTGGLASEGDITLSLEPDGLYTMKSTTSKLKPHTLELPAKLEVGGSWKDHTEMSDQDLVLDSELKIVDQVRVATPGGTFDEALHVVSKGSGKMRLPKDDGSTAVVPMDLDAEFWYVRDVGAVKQVLRIRPKEKGFKARNVTVQLTVPEKEPAPTTSPGPALPIPLPPETGAKK